MNGNGAAVDPASAQIWSDQTFTAYETVTLNTWDHGKYMDGSATVCSIPASHDPG